MNPGMTLVLVAVAVVAVMAVGALVALDAFARSRRQDLEALPREGVVVHGSALTLLVADSPATVGPGLSGQRQLPGDQGLLLVSPDGDTRVTMLGMRFALDVVWLDGQRRIVDLRRNVPARPLPLWYSPRQPAAAVLELAVGGIDRYGLDIGVVLGV